VAAAVLTAGFQEIPEDQGAPTPIEQALIEHGCSATRSNSAADAAAFHTCLTERLLVLRTDFGRDLSRLSAQERRAVDSVCSKVRAAEGRDAYVACLAGQLASLSDGRRGAAAASSTTAMPSSLVLSPVTSMPSSPGAPPPRSWSRALPIGLAVVTMFAVAAGGFLAMNAQRRPVKCRVCGVELPDRGDLCQACRHEAADALRRASMERAETERAQAEERHGRDREEQRAREEEEARREHVEREEERRQREQQEGEELRRQASAQQEARASAQVAAPEAVFDPYAVLGLTPDAGPEAIRAAYEEARARYDASHVAHLSDEVQTHFSRKAEAVERAYHMLSA
jgi:hypothetical protein